MSNTSYKTMYQEAECYNCNTPLGKWELNQMVDNSVSLSHTFPSRRKLGLKGAYYITLLNGTVTAFCSNCIRDAVSDVKDNLRVAKDPDYDYFNVNYK